MDKQELIEEVKKDEWSAVRVMENAEYEGIELDRDVILAAVETTAMALEFVPSSYRRDEELKQIVIKQFSEGVEKAKTVPAGMRSGLINGNCMNVLEMMKYEGIQVDFKEDVLNTIKLFDSDMLEDSKELLAEVSNVTMMGADDFRKCKDENKIELIESIIAIMEEKQKAERLEREAKEATLTETKVLQTEIEKEEKQETEIKVDERTSEIQKALLGLEALNLTEEEIDKLTAQLNQLKTRQGQKDKGEVDIGKGE